jgi:hypothetical protein
MQGERQRPSQAKPEQSDGNRPVVAQSREGDQRGRDRYKTDEAALDWMVEFCFRIRAGPNPPRRVERDQSDPYRRRGREDRFPDWGGQAPKPRARSPDMTESGNTEHGTEE